MNIDLSAQEHIVELEAQLEDAYVKIDLLEEALQEAHNGMILAKAQIAAMHNSQKVDYGVG